MSSSYACGCQTHNKAIEGVAAVFLAGAILMCRCGEKSPTTTIRDIDGQTKDLSKMVTASLYSCGHMDNFVGYYGGRGEVLTRKCHRCASGKERIWIDEKIWPNIVRRWIKCKGCGGYKRIDMDLDARKWTNALEEKHRKIDGAKAKAKVEAKTKAKVEAEAKFKANAKGKGSAKGKGKGKDKAKDTVAQRSTSPDNWTDATDQSSSGSDSWEDDDGCRNCGNRHHEHETKGSARGSPSPRNRRSTTPECNEDYVTCKKCGRHHVVCESIYMELRNNRSNIGTGLPSTRIGPIGPPSHPYRTKKTLHNLPF